MSANHPQQTRLRDQFRRRLLALLLILLLILLLARLLFNRPADGLLPSPVPASATATLAPSATVTPLPEFLFTPRFTFSVIPPTDALETLTPHPTNPPDALTPTPSHTPTNGVAITGTPSPDVTRRACKGYGRVRGKVWVVAGCDTLLNISRVTGISLERLLRANPEITDPNLIHPNQHIRLPGG